MQGKLVAVKIEDAAEGFLVTGVVAGLKNRKGAWNFSTPDLEPTRIAQMVEEKEAERKAKGKE